MKFIAVAIAIATPTAAFAEPLDLECRGNAVVTESSSTYEWTRDKEGSGHHYELQSHSNTVNAEGVVRVRIDDGGHGRIKIPGPLQTNGRGDDGWWDLSNLEVTEDVIRGRIAMGILTKPKVSIDRRTGDIDYQGGGARFAGACERATNAAERKF